MAVFSEDYEKMWEEMRKKEIEPDVVSYNTIIGGVEKGEEFFREMGLVGIDYWCNCFNLWTSAVLVYKDMFRNDFRPDASMLDMVVRLLCDKGRVKEGLE